MADINLDDIEVFTFPDGQPHIKVDKFLSTKTLLNPGIIDVICRIRNPNELFKLLMLQEVLIQKNYIARLHIKYLMGARMDREIDSGQPFTLKTVCDIINSMFPDSPVTVFCPHSDTVSVLLKNYVPFLEHEINFYRRTFEKMWDEPFTLVLPDAGAGKRWFNTFAGRFNDRLASKGVSVVECSKKRDMATGKLSSFKVPEQVQKRCLICDDIGDGCGTFVGLAKELRENGASHVELAVCHGIFSKGLPVEGIDKIHTTTSYKGWKFSDYLSVYRV